MTATLQKPTQIYRATLVDQLPIESEKFITISAPEKVWVVLDPLMPDKLPQLKRNVDGVHLINITICYGENELKHQALENNRTVKKLRLDGGEEVVFCPNNAILFFEEERTGRDDLLTAVVYFSYYHRKLRKLEKDLESIIPQVKKEAAFIHNTIAPMPHTLEHINSFNQLISLLTLEQLDLSRHLTTHTDSMSVEALAIFDKMCQEECIQARIHHLKEKLNHLSQIYRTAERSISHYSYNRRIYNIGLGLFTLLMIQTLFMIYDHFFYA